MNIGVCRSITQPLPPHLLSPVSIRNSHRNYTNRQHSGGKHQHKCSRPDPFDIADTEMGNDGPDEIEHQARSRHDPCWGPPDSNHQSNRASKLAPSQRREIFQWHTDSFVDHFNLTWVTPDFADAREQNHHGKHQSDCEVYGWNVAILLSVAVQRVLRTQIVLS